MLIPYRWKFSRDPNFAEGQSAKISRSNSSFADEHSRTAPPTIPVWLHLLPHAHRSSTCHRGAPCKSRLCVSRDSVRLGFYFAVSRFASQPQKSQKIGSFENFQPYGMSLLPPSSYENGDHGVPKIGDQFPVRLGTRGPHLYVTPHLT